MKTHNKMKTIITHGLTIFATFLIVGSSSAYKHTDVYAQETQKDNLYNNIICNLPDDIIDPGSEIPKYISAPKITQISNKNNALIIKWNKVKDVTGYRIQRKTGNAAWKDLKIINTTQYTDNTVVNGQNYKYRVYAYVAGSIDYIEKTDANSITKTYLYLTAPSINSAKKLKNNKCKITWKKNNKADGYKIQTSTSKDFKKASTKGITSAKKVSTNINNINKSKTYYIRIRAYKQNGKTTYYSTWSNSKKIK